MKMRRLFPIALSLIAIVKTQVSGIELQRKPSISAFPILMYDSDIGLGFGGKGVVNNRFREDESFDLILIGKIEDEPRKYLI